MRYFITILYLFFIGLNIFCQTNENALIPIERHSFASQILEENRSFQVYLTPSYYYSNRGDFPIIYLMDGDYNFYHDTGLIELRTKAVSTRPIKELEDSERSMWKYLNLLLPIILVIGYGIFRSQRQRNRRIRRMQESYV